MKPYGVIARFNARNAKFLAAQAEQAQRLGTKSAKTKPEKAGETIVVGHNLDRALSEVVTKAKAKKGS